MLNSNVTWFPPHLIGANCYKPPSLLSHYAERYGVVNIVFIDDELKGERSFRQEENIFINTRCTYWDAMILPPWLCKRPGEIILLRFLHEVGHVALKHPPDIGISSTPNGLIVQRLSSIWDALRDQEGECWKWVFCERKAKRSEYRILKSAIEDWYSGHTYEHKDWHDSPEAQWAKVKNESLPSDLWQGVPSWVRYEFQSEI
jgi:hypothetical protein